MTDAFAAASGGVGEYEQNEGDCNPLVDLFRVLAGAHSVGGGVFGFLTTRDGNELRQLCRLIRGDVAAARWRDAVTPIRGSLAAWRACFPGAVAANVGGRKDLRDADFVRLAGVKLLDMTRCFWITDGGLAHLNGIHTLDMGWCTGITNAGLAHLAGVHTLDLTYCRGITDAGLAHLTGIQQLVMRHCAPAAIAAARKRKFPVIAEED
jgi:hypothetical protein